MTTAPTTDRIASARRAYQRAHRPETFQPGDVVLVGSHQQIGIVSRICSGTHADVTLTLRNGTSYNKIVPLHKLGIA